VLFRLAALIQVDGFNGPLLGADLKLTPDGDQVDSWQAPTTLSRFIDRAVGIMG